MKFIKLTDIDGLSCLISLDCISGIEDMGDERSVSIIGDDYVEVKETIDEIERIIKTELLRG